MAVVLVLCFTKLCVLVEALVAFYRGCNFFIVGVYFLANQMRIFIRIK